MSQYLILYHANCNDGFGAAYLAAQWIGLQNVPYELIPVQYGHAPPDVRGKQVEIVDFSYPRDVLLRMKQDATWLRVIDHHATAQKDLEGLDFCKFDMDRSACRIVWDEIYGGKPADWVAYIEDRDLWRKALPHSDEVAAWVRTVQHDEESWGRDVIEMPISVQIERGAAIRRYQDKLMGLAVAGAIPASIGGYQVRVCNATSDYSEVAGELAKGEPFGAVWFGVGREVVFSLRSEPNGIDVGAFAKEHFGGGGHKHASGFKVSIDEFAQIMTRVPAPATRSPR